MFRFFTFYLFTILACQAATLDITLWEKGTKKKLSNVNIFLLPEKSKHTTDDEGKTNIQTNANGECQVIINLTGYNKLEKNLLCQNDQQINLYLERKNYMAFETTVRSKVTKRDDVAHGLSQEDFLQAAGTFGGDPVRAAQNLPGVAQNGANAQIIVQGASPDDTMYTINGHQVPNVFHFGGLSSVMIPNAVDEVQLLPSGYGPEYSKAMGGIINLTSKQPETTRLKGMAFIDLLNAGGYVEGPIDNKSSFLFSARYSYIGAVLKEVMKNNDKVGMTAAPTYMDTTGIYQRRIGDKHLFKTTLVASRDELELVFKKAARNDPALTGNFYNRTQFFRFIPQYIHNFSEKTKWDNSLGIGQDQTLINIGGKYLDIESKKITQRSELSHQWTTSNASYFGLDNQFSWYDVNVNLPNSFSAGNVNNPFGVGEQRKFRSRGASKDLGAYIRHSFKPSAESSWTFLPNLRYDHFGITGQGMLQPRFQTRYQIDPSLQLRSSVGQYAQPPQPQEADKFYGNPNIKPPHATHYTVGWTKDFKGNQTNGFEITNNFFYKQLHNLVVPSIAQNYTNQGSGKISGMEIQTKYRWNEYSARLVYTYLHSRRQIPGYGTFPSEYDQTHNLNLIGAYQGERWSFSGRFRYVTGNPYTPVLNGVYDGDHDVYIPVRGGLFSQRVSDFMQMDIRIDRKYIYDTWILSVYLDIQNVLNNKNIQSISYSYDYTQKDNIYGLPILPTIGMKGEF